MTYFLLFSEKKINRICAKLLISPILLFISFQLYSQPVINSFSPMSGPVGTMVTIIGNNFELVPGNNLVFFGGLKAVVTAASPTTLSVTVPQGVSYDYITVTNNNRTAYSPKPFTVTFSSFSANFRNTSYFGKTDIPIPSLVNTMSVSDIDGDGLLDVVAATPGINAISVYRNTGTIGNLSFTKSDFAIGVDPVQAVAADLDGDGKPEIIATCGNTINTRKIVIYQNSSSTGVPGFGDTIEIKSTNIDFRPDRICISDMNSDGKPDIVVKSNGAVSIYRNTSSGSELHFTRAYEGQIGIRFQDICVTDLDGDGKPDVVVSVNLPNLLRVMRNISTTDNLELAFVIDLITGANTTSVKAADIDGDGKEDVCAVNSDSRTVSIFRSTSTVGNISFANKQDFGTDNLPVRLSISDINGDGKLDMAVANNASNSVTVIKNVSVPGAISFNPGVNIPVSASPLDVLTEDFDKDGLPDLLTSHSSLTTFSFCRSKVLLPNISSFSPSTAGTDSLVIIKGYNLTPAEAVTFGVLAAASFTVISDTQVNAKVGTGASGAVVINTSYGITTLPGFTFVPLPVIDDFSPASGTMADTITITGSNFTTAFYVSFGGTTASSFSVVSPTTIKAVVGRGASGQVLVSTIGGNVASGGFTYRTPPPPVITSFTPHRASQGESITITGQHFASVTAIRFGGITAQSFQVISSTTLKAVVNTGGTGDLSIVSDGGAASEPGFVYALAPAISSFTPHSGPIGTTVTISGSNFNPVSTENIVFFGSTKAEIISATANSISVKVPAGATYNPISITSDRLTGFSSRPFKVTFAGIGSNFVSQSFPLLQNMPAGQAPIDIAVGDLDGDGYNDVANASFLDGNVSIYRNLSFNKSISFAGKFDVPASADFDMGGVEICDLNGDGKPELISANQSGGVSIFPNTSVPGTISFGQSLPFHGGNSIDAVTSGDVDGDGKTDLLFSTNSGFSVIRNKSINGSISFEAPLEITAGYTCSDIAVCDLDGDNRPDIAVISTQSSSANTGTVSVFKNLTTPGMTLTAASFGTKLDLSTGAIPTGVAIYDLDDDDKPELIVTSYSDGVTIYRNLTPSGTISFAQRLDVAVGSIPYNLAVSDLDGDGKPDIATSNFGGQSISCLKNISTTGQVNFATVVDFATSGQQLAIRVADLDNDGRPDLASSDYSRDFVALMRNHIGEPTLRRSGTNPLPTAVPVTKTSVVEPAVESYRGRVYVQRHYDVEPMFNASSSTGTIILYFTQQEFDNYNAFAGHGLDLPKNPTDAVGKAALRVTQFHGTSTTLMPGSYTGDSVEIDPDDNFINWNATAEWWEVRFDVTGFSGFFISSVYSGALPLNLISFNAKLTGQSVKLSWTTTDEVNVSHFEIQRSINNGTFKTIGNVLANNYSGIQQYLFTDMPGSAPEYYYRLKMVDIDGNFTLSKTLKIEQELIHVGIHVNPNPLHKSAAVVRHPKISEHSIIRLFNSAGQTVKTFKVSKNTQETIIQVAGISAGTYILNWTNGSVSHNVQIVIN